MKLSLYDGVTFRTNYKYCKCFKETYIVNTNARLYKHKSELLDKFYLIQCHAVKVYDGV